MEPLSSKGQASIGGIKIINYQNLGSFNETKLKRIYKSNSVQYLMEYMIRQLPNIDEIIIKCHK